MYAKHIESGTFGEKIVKYEIMSEDINCTEDIIDFLNKSEEEVSSMYQYDFNGFKIEGHILLALIKKFQEM